MLLIASDCSQVAAEASHRQALAAVAAVASSDLPTSAPPTLLLAGTPPLSPTAAVAAALVHADVSTPPMAIALPAAEVALDGQPPDGPPEGPLDGRPLFLAPRVVKSPIQTARDYFEAGGVGGAARPHDTPAAKAAAAEKAVTSEAEAENVGQQQPPTSQLEQQQVMQQQQQQIDQQTRQLQQQHQAYQQAQQQQRRQLHEQQAEAERLGVRLTQLFVWCSLRPLEPSPFALIRTRTHPLAINRSLLSEAPPHSPQPSHGLSPPRSIPPHPPSAPKPILIRTLSRSPPSLVRTQVGAARGLLARRRESAGTRRADELRAPAGRSRPLPWRGRLMALRRRAGEERGAPHSPRTTASPPPRATAPRHRLAARHRLTPSTAPSPCLSLAEQLATEQRDESVYRACLHVRGSRLQSGLAAWWRAAAAL